MRTPRRWRPALDGCNVNQHRCTRLWGLRVRGSVSRRKRFRTDKSSGQQLSRERRPTLDSSRCTCRPLASSKLHQPGPPQGSGPDWLLSSPGTSNRSAVVGCCCCCYCCCCFRHVFNSVFVHSCDDDAAVSGTHIGGGSPGSQDSRRPRHPSCV